MIRMLRKCKHSLSQTIVDFVMKPLLTLSLFLMKRLTTVLNLLNFRLSLSAVVKSKNFVSRLFLVRLMS